MSEQGNGQVAKLVLCTYLAVSDPIFAGVGGCIRSSPSVMRFDVICLLCLADDEAAESKHQRNPVMGDAPLQKPLNKFMYGFSCRSLFNTFMYGLSLPLNWNSNRKESGPLDEKAWGLGVWGFAGQQAIRIGSTE